MHKIAILDNDISSRRMYVMKLMLHNFSVRTASDGWSGLRLVTSYKPDLIMVDHYLPVLSGIETIEKLMNHPVKIPIIIVTSNLDHKIVKRRYHHLPIKNIL